MSDVTLMVQLSDLGGAVDPQLVRADVEHVVRDLLDEIPTAGLLVTVVATPDPDQPRCQVCGTPQHLWPTDGDPTL